jgi:pimeloyl-ACP methyl ester carboxylesterase
MVSAWEHTFSFDTAAALSALQVPALSVGGGAPLGPNGVSLPIGSTDAIAAHSPRVVVGQTVCAGHFIQLDAADQVNAMIERFLTVAIRSGTEAV